jgi:hypothetical protein
MLENQSNKRAFGNRPAPAAIGEDLRLFLGNTWGWMLHVHDVPSLPTKAAERLWWRDIGRGPRILLSRPPMDTKGGTELIDDRRQR